MSKEEADRICPATVSTNRSGEALAGIAASTRRDPQFSRREANRNMVGNCPSGLEIARFAPSIARLHLPLPLLVSRRAIWGHPNFSWQKFVGELNSWSGEATDQMAKLLPIAPNPEESASEDYRIYQFMPYLQRAGFECTACPFAGRELLRAVQAERLTNWSFCALVPEL